MVWISAPSPLSQALRLSSGEVGWGMQGNWDLNDRQSISRKRLLNGLTDLFERIAPLRVGSKRLRQGDEVRVHERFVAKQMPFFPLTVVHNTKSMVVKE